MFPFPSTPETTFEIARQRQRTDTERARRFRITRRRRSDHPEQSTDA